MQKLILPFGTEPHPIRSRRALRYEGWCVFAIQSAGQLSLTFSLLSQPSRPTLVSLADLGADLISSLAADLGSRLPTANPNYPKFGAYFKELLASPPKITMYEELPKGGSKL